MKSVHIAVIGAHAMDAEVMAGGLIAKATRSGHKATLIHMTRGERGHPFKKPEEFAEQLDQEMIEAARVLGAEVKWLGYSAGNLPIADEVSDKIYQIIMEINPTHIITHWRGSWHPRHVSTHYNVLKAIKMAILRHKFQLKGLYYGENCEDLNGFNPTIYIDISDVKDIWFDALTKYELFRLSLKNTNIIPYASYYNVISKIRGFEAGVPYAQAFMEERKLWNSLDIQEYAFLALDPKIEF
jgi:LmbE family N-acetylglucosaminyl deacetylase